MTGKEFTPALGYGFLTPVYDLAVGLLTRERRWRSDLVRLIDPQPGDRILDVGCGTGSLLLLLGRVEPEARLIGLDPDPEALRIAGAKANGDSDFCELTLQHGAFPVYELFAGRTDAREFPKFSGNPRRAPPTFCANRRH